MKKVIKVVLVVGLGSMGKRHVQIIKSLFPEVKIIALRHKHCNSVEDKLGLFKCLTSLEEAIKFSPQVAIISNPASKHVDIAIR